MNFAVQVTFRKLIVSVYAVLALLLLFGYIWLPFASVSPISLFLPLTLHGPCFFMVFVIGVTAPVGSIPAFFVFLLGLLGFPGLAIWAVFYSVIAYYLWYRSRRAWTIALGSTLLTATLNAAIMIYTGSLWQPLFNPVPGIVFNLILAYSLYWRRGEFPPEKDED